MRDALINPDVQLVFTATSEIVLPAPGRWLSGQKLGSICTYPLGALRERWDALSDEAARLAGFPF
jgi:hypothetical protein